MSEASPEFLAAWLVDIGEKAGKGVADNIDGRALIRVGEALKASEQARQAAEARVAELEGAYLLPSSFKSGEDYVFVNIDKWKARAEQAEAKLAEATNWAKQIEAVGWQQSSPKQWRIELYVETGKQAADLGRMIDEMRNK